MTRENPFKTVYKGDYIWPYMVPILYKASKPPSDVGMQPLRVESPVVSEPLCMCDRHSWNPHIARAKHLREKERVFREAMLAVAAERTTLENEIIQHPCASSEEVIASMYTSDYTKSAFPVADYRSMKKDHDDPTVTPVAMLKDPKHTSYRDSASFKKIALQPKDIQGPRPIDFSSKEPQVSESNPYETEYSGRISKVATMNMALNESIKDNYA